MKPLSSRSDGRESSADETESSSVQTRRAQVGDLDAIVRVHVLSFPGFFLSHLGPGFLYQYYRLVMEYEHGVVVIAESEGRVVGFVSGAVNPDSFFTLMRRSKTRFVLPVLAAVVRNPLIMPRLVVNVRKVSGARQTDGSSGRLAELASMAVDPQWSGKGVGRTLVRAFLSAASEAGVDEVYLTTDAHNNDRVNRFYQRLGFAVVETFDSAGRMMNRYSIRMTRTTERSSDD